MIKKVQIYLQKFTLLSFKNSIKFSIKKIPQLPQKSQNPIKTLNFNFNDLKKIVPTTLIYPRACWYLCDLLSINESTREIWLSPLKSLSTRTFHLNSWMKFLKFLHFSQSASLYTSTRERESLRDDNRQQRQTHAARNFFCTELSQNMRDLQ